MCMQKLVKCFTQTCFFSSAAHQLPWKRSKMATKQTLKGNGIKSIVLTADLLAAVCYYTETRSSKDDAQI